MNFDLSEEQALLSDAVGKLFDSHANQASPDPAAQWRDYRDFGLTGLPFSDDLGGPEAVMLVMEAYGRTLGTAPYLQSVLLAGRLLERAGSARAQAVLADVQNGSARPALALYEPGTRYTWDEPRTKAVRSDDGWRIAGGKVAVLDGADADLLIVPATTPEGLGLFLVPADAPGLSVTRRPTPDGRSAADITLANVSLPTDAALAAPDRTNEIVAEAIDGAIAATCAEAVGAMEKLLAITVDYLGVRKQFGVPIGSFQSLQHRAADMLVAIEQARSITFYAVSMMGAASRDRTAACAAAKALVNRAARFVGTQAIQLHGGMGLTSEYPAGRYFQRLTVIENLFGDTDHLLALVEQNGGLAD